MFLFISSLIPTKAKPCPPGWIYHEVINSTQGDIFSRVNCFLPSIMLDGKKRYQAEAATYCEEKLHASLVRIDNKEVDTFLPSIFGSMAGEYFFIFLIHIHKLD